MPNKTLSDDARQGAAETTAEGSPRRWWILAVIAVAQLMVVLDATIVNIALPSAQADLGFSDGNRQWVVTAYALAFASLLLLGGRLADLFGRKPAFLVGVAGFAAASALGGAATGFGMLVVARALQGVFGALLAPAALSLLNTTFTDAREKARAFSVYGAIAGAGGAVGLLLGGLLTDAFDWRWTLYVNVLIAVVAFAGGWTLLGSHRDAAGSKLDVPGTILVAAGLFSVVYGFSNAETLTGTPRRPGASSSRAACCWWCSPGGRAGPRTRCCRCASCWTATGAPRSSRCSSPAPACSVCSSSSPTTSS
ncbi:hypothetical protein GCM10020256_04120 [Streptomyces thermocoprophilus]